ncbi:hypothetical protein GQR58_015169 [Nymphon striatum]|nr:hypothetical protein GQR58_015169 [Nymphon striatum]
MDTFNNDLQFHKCLVTDTLYGDWYEIMSFQKTGSCVKIRFTPNEDGKSYGLEASAILSIFQMFGVLRARVTNAIMQFSLMSGSKMQKGVKRSSLLVPNMTQKAENVLERNDFRLLDNSFICIIVKKNIKKPTLRAGNLTVPNPENPAKMDLNFPSTTKDLWIVDTDYKTYLATWNCKENYFGHYQTASIMSRERKMDPKLLKKVRNIFAQYHINTYDFNYIGQKDCPDLQTIRRDGVLFPL